MIKANELRIGNLIEIKNSERQYYYSVTGHDIETIESYHDNFEGDSYPIPLTPEILEKAGFENEQQQLVIKAERKRGDPWSEVKLIVKGGQDGYWWIGLEPDDHHFYTLVEYRYLHQLQNLYFALCGEELNIQL